jgi:hypothetical protein
MLPQPKLVILDLGDVRKWYTEFIGDLEVDADFKEAVELALCFIDDHDSADLQIDEMVSAVMDNYADHNLGSHILDVVNAYGSVARWFAEEMCRNHLFFYPGPHEFKFDRWIGTRSVAIRLEPLATNGTR